MLKFEESEEQSTSPDQLRVSPRELSEAVAAIESRRMASARSNDTITVTDAVSQLGLSVSPEELAAELESRRRTMQQSRARARSRIIRIRNYLLGLMLVGSLALNVYFFATNGRTYPAGFNKQNGTFHTIAGRSGTVKFASPFSRPPNVELEGLNTQFNKTEISDITSTGFTWHNTGQDDIFNNSEVQWTARSGP